MNRKNVKEMIEWVIPFYGIGLIAAMLSLNAVTYFGTRLVTTGRYHYNIESPLDRMLPLVPFFVLFYVLAYLQWALCYVLIGREKKADCYYFFIGEMIAKSICLVIFLAFPTTLNRPQIIGGGIFERLLSFVYAHDAADNLFPSIHCLESWLCYRGCRHLSKTPVPRWFSGANLCLSLLVFASTVLCKQHVLIDIAGGVAAVEIGLFFSGKILKKAGIT